jgi:hypothetical protein
MNAKLLGESFTRGSFTISVEQYVELAIRRFRCDLTSHLMAVNTCRRASSSISNNRPGGRNQTFKVAIKGCLMGHG